LVSTVTWRAVGTLISNKHQQDLGEDHKIRTYLKKELYYAGIANIIIERTAKRLRVTIVAARPGIIIGKKGADIEKLKTAVQKLVGKPISINIKEEKKAQISAQLVAENVATQLERRVAFRRAMKKVIQNAQRSGAKGIKVAVAGRLGGAEMARTEQYKEGQIPLNKIRADIKYWNTTANTIYGSIGVSVWIFKGEIIGDVDLTPGAQAAKEAESKRGRRGGDDRGKRNNRRRSRNRNRQNN